MLTIFPFQTSNTTLNQNENGLLELLLEVAQNYNVKVRLLIARITSANNIIEKLRDKRNIEIKFIEPLPEAIPTIDGRDSLKTVLLIVDKQSALALASKENDLNNSASSAAPPAVFFSDKKETLYAICTTKADVLSHVTAFESQWIQSEIHEKIKSHQKKEDEFLNVAAHELRTPIQPILGLTQVLRSKINDVQQQELLDVIMRNAKKLQQLSDDILEVTRIESKKLILNKERFNLNDTIYEIVQDYKNNLIKEDFNRKLVFEDPNIIFFVEADKNRISQVITNLINNSLKFTTKGTIAISLFRTRIEVRKGYDNNNNKNNVATREAVEVRVTDTGAGIDPDILPRLFTKFASKSYKGTGLGLFLSKGIIETHGGTIWAQNNNKNDNGKPGCTFYFVLPVIKDQENLSGRKKRVLLVDDNLNFTSKLEPILGNKHDVHIFNDPVLAMNNFVSGLYDVVILGVELRNMSGFDLCQQIRQKDKKAKVYFLTEGGKTHYKALRELYGISDSEQFLDRDELETYNLG